MQVIEAVIRLSPTCECSVSGEPTNETEYNSNVQYHRGGALPDWADVNNLINDIPTARADKIKQINSQATGILRDNFDFHVIRNSDPGDGKPIPASAVAYKATIRDECGIGEDAVNAETDINVINAYTVDWSPPPAT